MAGPAEEELGALAAIFCGPGEWEVLSRSETDGTVFRILTEAEGPTEHVAVPLELVFHLPAGYPSCAPGISVSSERLTRAQRAAVREELLERAQSLPAEPMVHQLVLWAQQHLGRILTQTGLGPGPGPRPSSTTGQGDEGLWMALLRLDHMRARTRYVKALRQWASDLGLTGRLVFLGKAILLLLQGRREDIKEYLVLQKTCRVDVDASGKKCREKMLSVLFEGPAQPQHARFPAFEVREDPGVDELRAEFEAAGLQGLLSEFVLGLAK
ncbi:RWD domain-containing protein 3 [Artibeus jamaicensis]|uniref:RWD domain-containing protein 3 n=1 Tax=Artibeus jamaicensis TaxID=9417 RepID=UPI00235A4797|nr:RWD domain-containing protein 3 [Artibeus jamaicensis]XP_053512055.1 RWD domain-containing protein 3 [Artibeus jamaicensis]